MITFRTHLFRLSPETKVYSRCQTQKPTDEEDRRIFLSASRHSKTLKIHFKLVPDFENTCWLEAIPDFGSGQRLEFQIGRFGQTRSESHGESQQLAQTDSDRPRNSQKRRRVGNFPVQLHVEPWFLETKCPNFRRFKMREADTGNQK